MGRGRKFRAKLPPTASLIRVQSLRIQTSPASRRSARRHRDARTNWKLRDACSGLCGDSAGLFPSPTPSTFYVPTYVQIFYSPFSWMN